MTERRAAYRTKYHNRPTTIDGIRFDSASEARRYAQLRLMVQAGEITMLRVHPVYNLVDGFTRGNGERIRPITYEADFEYQRPGQRPAVEDVKGVETDVFKLKRKIFQQRYDAQYELVVLKLEDF